MVYASPIFKSMSFNCSPFRGGTDLNLEGTSFFASDLIRVRFSPTAEGLDPIVVGAKYDPESGNIICTTPPLEDTHAHYIPNEEQWIQAQEAAAAAKAKEARERQRNGGPAPGPEEDEEEEPRFDPNLHTVVDISLDGGLTYSNEKHNFMFYNDPTFTTVTPEVVGAGGRGTVIHITGTGLFQLPKATGSQRSVIGVRFNVFEAKEGDDVIPEAKKKKKTVRVICSSVHRIKLELMCVCVCFCAWVL